MRGASPKRKALGTIVAALALAAVAAGCGGGGGGTTTSRADTIARIEKGCERLSGYSIWLPEHLEKTGRSLKEGQGLVDKATAEYRDLLEGLDPPADLKAPIGRVIDFRFDGSKSTADFVAREERLAGIYDGIGADRCREEIEAAVLELKKGLSVQDAYSRVGAPIPPHPPGW